jgi:hypothetical protein
VQLTAEGERGIPATRPFTASTSSLEPAAASRNVPVRAFRRLFGRSEEGRFTGREPYPSPRLHSARVQKNGVCHPFASRFRLRHEDPSRPWLHRHGRPRELRG